MRKQHKEKKKKKRKYKNKDKIWFTFNLKAIFRNLIIRFLWKSTQINQATTINTKFSSSTFKLKWNPKNKRKIVNIWEKMNYNYYNLNF